MTSIMPGMSPGMSALAPTLLQDPTASMRLIPGMTKDAALGVAKATRPDDARELYDKASTKEELKLRDVANEFVSVLQSMIYKQMDAGIERTGLLSGGAMEETFRPMLMDEYTKMSTTQQGNMLSHRVYEMMYNATFSTRGGESAAAAPKK